MTIVADTYLPKTRDILSEKTISQSDLAKRTGLSPTTVKKVVDGHPTSRKTAYRIAHGLGVSVDYLMGETDNPGSITKTPPALSLVAGQRDVVEYPQGPPEPLTDFVEARMNVFERELGLMRSQLDAIKEGVEEIATRPVARPARTVVLTEYSEE